MKAHLTKLSLALLSTVFLFGCQDMGSEPVGPEGLGPEFDRKSDDQFCLDGVTLRDKGHCHGDDGDGVVDPGTLFSRPGDVGTATGYTCGGGAAIIADDATLGTVNFNQPRDDSHTHANVQLRGVDPGVYLILGNHDKVCQATEPDPINPKPEPFNFPVFDFPLRPGHATKVTVGANGKGKARIGLTYRTQTPKTRTIIDQDGNEVTVDGFDFLDDELLAMHVDGPHNLWLTITGPLDANGELPPNPPVVLRSVAVVVVIPVHDEL